MNYLFLDSSNILHRYFAGMPVLTAPNGMQTHAMVGWVHFITNPRKKFQYLPKDTEIITFWDDTGRGNNIKEDGPEWFDYKGNRVRQNPEFYEQLHLAKKITEWLGIKTVEEKGEEADFLIGDLVLNRRGEDRIWIASTDKDMLQLVLDGEVEIAHLDKKEPVTSQHVIEKWGVKPSQMAELLVIMGDKSDNVPGIPGLGIKAAQHILSEYGTIESALASTTEKPCKNIRILKENASLIPGLRRAVTLTRRTPPNVRENQPNIKLALAVLRELNMSQASNAVRDFQIRMSRALLSKTGQTGRSESSWEGTRSELVRSGP